MTTNPRIKKNDIIAELTALQKISLQMLWLFFISSVVFYYTTAVCAYGTFNVAVTVLTYVTPFVMKAALLYLCLGDEFLAFSFLLVGAKAIILTIIFNLQRQVPYPDKDATPLRVSALRAFDLTSYLALGLVFIFAMDAVQSYYGYPTGLMGNAVRVAPDVHEMSARETIDKLQQFRAGVSQQSTAYVQDLKAGKYTLDVSNPWEVGNHLGVHLVQSMHEELGKPGNLRLAEPIAQPKPRVERMPQTPVYAVEVLGGCAAFLALAFVAFGAGLLAGRRFKNLNRISNNEICTVAQERGVVLATPVTSNASAIELPLLEPKTCGPILDFLFKCKHVWTEEIWPLIVAICYRGLTPGEISAIRYVIDNMPIEQKVEYFFRFLGGVTVPSVMAYLKYRQARNAAAKEAELDRISGEVPALVETHRLNYIAKHTLPEPPVVFVYDAPVKLIDLLTSTANKLLDTYPTFVILFFLTVAGLLLITWASIVWATRHRLKSLSTAHLMKLAEGRGMVVVTAVPAPQFSAAIVVSADDDRIQPKELHIVQQLCYKVYTECLHLQGLDFMTQDIVFGEVDQ